MSVKIREEKSPAHANPSSTGFWTTRMSSSPCSCSSSKLIAYELQARFRNSDSSIDQWLLSSVLLSLCSGIDFVSWVLFVFSADASFSESLYGLRRRAVVLPYFKSKLHSIYNRERETRVQASLWGHVERFDDADTFDRGDDAVVSRGTSDMAVSKFIGACYPLLHAGCEGFSFTYQMLYLLDAPGFYSLGLHVLGIHVCRATGQELMDTSSRMSKTRVRERERLRGPPWLKAKAVKARHVAVTETPTMNEPELKQRNLFLQWKHLLDHIDSLQTRFKELHDRFYSERSSRRGWSPKF
ncbi:unnamed protein product [Malus baccata var. baccata]